MKSLVLMAVPTDNGEPSVKGGCSLYVWFFRIAFLLQPALLSGVAVCSGAPVLSGAACVSPLAALA